MTEIPEPDPALSSDAQHSTYTEHTPTEEELAQYPPPGPATEQERGLPTETAQPKTTRSSRSSGTTKSES